MSLPTIGWFGNIVGAHFPSLFSDFSLGPISIDTRTLKPGDTFWAIKSSRDGHDFVPAAFTSGAKAAVVNFDWMQSPDAEPYRERLIAVPETTLALTHAARAWRNSLPFPQIGITGTNGKTSTKDILLRILSVKRKATGTPGNFNNEIGVPLTLLATPSDCDAAVIEMGASHPGEIADLCQLVRPTHGLVTSIGRAHLAGFGTLEEIARTKGALYDAVAENGIAYVPTDDALCLTEATECRHKIGYGFSGKPADWKAEFYQGTKLTFDSSGCARFEFERVEIELSVPGRPAALSALAALTIARNFGLYAEEVRKVIQAWQGVGGRVSIERLGGITVMDDSYNANPMSMRAALETLSFLPARRHVAILGDMNELGSDAESEHRALGRDLKQFDLSLSLFVGAFAPLAASEARGQGIEAKAFATYEECDAELATLICAGDAVLVKGSRSMRLERAVQKLKTLYT
ncbi:MAG TPA: UDP-N-acetylmuramoyl-tripeptide--D-alanyl-D-alanine ligase [bacterium]|jgi:UDP-N-acetylmuramoyl-tripeptide--D-alanyl-D-alanine ligase